MRVTEVECASVPYECHDSNDRDDEHQDVEESVYRGGQATRKIADVSGQFGRRVSHTPREPYDDQHPDPVCHRPVPSFAAGQRSAVRITWKQSRAGRISLQEGFFCHRLLPRLD